MSMKSSSLGDQKMTNPFRGKAFYLIKAHKALKLQVQERIISAKVRIHPPEPQAGIEWQGNGWTWNQEFMEVLIFGRYLGISFTYYFHCYDKWHEYPNQITRRRHPATETKQKKSRNCWMCLFVPNASLNTIPIILIYCTLLYIRQPELLLKCFFLFHFRFNAIIKQNIY